MRTVPMTEHGRPVVLEGNIGSGKSTFISALGVGSQERVEAWREFLAWKDASPGARMATQLRILSDYTGPQNGLYERSWCSTIAFALVHLKSADRLYLDAFVCHVVALINAGALVIPRAVIHLDVSPETCEKRIASRGQPGDEGITVEFLKQLEAAHQGLLAFYAELGVPIIPASGRDKCGVAYNAALNSVGTKPCNADISNALRRWCN